MRKIALTSGLLAVATLGLTLSSPLVVNADSGSLDDMITNVYGTQQSTAPSVPSSVVEMADQAEVNTLDNYVTVVNNRFVLNVPSGVTVSHKTLVMAKNEIAKANKQVAKQGLTIDPVTRTATIEQISTRSFGRNAIEMHWNYARVYLDRTQAQALVSAAISGGSTALGGYFGSIGGAAAGAAIGGYLSAVAGANIRNGVWVDFNYFSFYAMRWGWQ